MSKDNKGNVATLQPQSLPQQVDKTKAIDPKLLEKQPKSDLQSGSQVRFDPELNVNPFKAIASATVGFPIACATTAFIGIFVGIAKLIQLAGIHISNKTLKKDQDPMAALPYEILTGALKSMWTNFGVYSVIAGGETAKFFFNQAVKSVDVGMQNFFKTELMKAEEAFVKGEISKEDIEKKMNEGINGGAAKTLNEAISKTPKDQLSELSKQMPEAAKEVAAIKELPTEAVKPLIETAAGIANQTEKASGPGTNPKGPEEDKRRKKIKSKL